MRGTTRIALMLGIAAALASPATLALADHTAISVNGSEYTSYQHAGPVDHYLTPSTGVTSASSVFTARHTWDGVHGADNLPCEGGQLHWVDNSQLLTISDCREGTPTETPPPTTPPPTSPPPTTPPPTTPPPTEPPPTSPPPTSPPTDPPSNDWNPSWTPSTDPATGARHDDLPNTGSDVTGPALAAGILAAIGLGSLWLGRKRSL